MASPDRQATTDLMAELAAKPFSFDFFRALRLLQCASREHPRIGCSQWPQEDAIRFGQNPTLTFATSTLEKLEPSADPDRPPKLSVHCFGLLGPNGPMPLQLTQFVRDRQRDGDRGLAAFLNVFNHRLISLFFKSWAASQKTVDIDRAGSGPETAGMDPVSSQRFGIFIGSLFGLGMDSLRHRDSVPDRAKLYFAGRLAHQPRNAEGLEAIIEEYFGVPTRIEPLRGRWRELPRENRSRLGKTSLTNVLGRNAIAGRHIWDCQLGFRLRLGPMPLKDYERMLPHARDELSTKASSFDRMKDWVLNYVHEQFLWDVQLVLKADEVPRTCLARSGRLGWTTWVRKNPFPHDADNVVLTPDRGAGP